MKLHIYLLAALLPLLAACDSTPSSASADKPTSNKANSAATASKTATATPVAVTSTPVKAIPGGATSTTTSPAAPAITAKLTPPPAATPTATTAKPASSTATTAKPTIAPSATTLAATAKPTIAPSATTLAATAPATAKTLATTSTAATTPVITVYKSPTCSCCSRWVTHLKANGFTVKSVNVPNVIPYKQKAGVTPQLASCHTAFVNGYVVEGHVPASEIKQMLKQKPAIKGISVPAMPHGTPGMDVSGRKDPYDVVSFDKNGQVKVYKSYR